MLTPLYFTLLGIARGTTMDTKLYVGIKAIKAFPMTRADYNKFRQWTLPTNENGADEGYLVEYQDGGAPNVVGMKGYVSWSPKEQFENAYRECTQQEADSVIEAFNEAFPKPEPVAEAPVVEADPHSDDESAGEPQ